MGMLNGGIGGPTIFEKETKTKQSEAAAVDINVILKNYERSGYLPPPLKAAVFTDVSDIGDFREAVAVIEAARDGFMQLPAEVRSRFDNDPAAFLDYISQPQQYDELVKLGLVEAKAPESGVAAVEPPQPRS